MTGFTASCPILFLLTCCIILHAPFAISQIVEVLSVPSRLVIKIYGSYLIITDGLFTHIDGNTINTRLRDSHRIFFTIVTFTQHSIIVYIIITLTTFDSRHKDKRLVGFQLSESLIDSFILTEHLLCFRFITIIFRTHTRDVNRVIFSRHIIDAIHHEDHEIAFQTTKSLIQSAISTHLPTQCTVGIATEFSQFTYCICLIMGQSQL